jgi:hypothetical protein
MDRFDRQDYAERWLSDAFRVIQENPPGFLVYVDIEMTRVQALIAELRRVGFVALLGRCWCVRRDLRWLAIRICISCSLGVGGCIQSEWTSDCLLPMKRWRLR